MKTSEQIGELFAALALAKLEYKPLKKSKNNPFFKSKYADLSDVQEATSEALSNHGLAIVQGCNMVDGRIIIETILGHKSGQFIESYLSLKPEKDTPQGIGSTLTYGMRYSWQAIVGISGEPDDDGNEATYSSQKPKEESKPILFNIKNNEQLEKLIKSLSIGNVHPDHHDEIAIMLEGKAFTRTEINQAIRIVTDKFVKKSINQ